MWLWHGTYEMFYKDILKSNEIRYSPQNQDNITKILDTHINQVAKRNIRGNCIYLSNDIECMEAFDKSFRFSTKNMDTSKLYVADNRRLDSILSYMGSDREILEIQKYIESYISFNNYIKIRDRYDTIYHPEFIYYGAIKVKN